MKITGEAKLLRKDVCGKKGEKTLFYLLAQEKDREAPIYCRLTNEMQSIINCVDKREVYSIEIVDSFFCVDEYRKGEQTYNKPAIVITNLHLFD